MSDKFGRFTKSARQVLTHAQAEAQLMNHGYIGTEHLLLGLGRQESSIPAKVLRDAGVELPKARAIVEEMVGKGKRGQFGRVSLTSRTKRVIELAVDEARVMGHHTIGPEHLLLGLLREGMGIAAHVLQTMSVNMQTLREQTMQQMPAQTLHEASADINPEIAKLIELVGASKRLSADEQHKVTEALQVVAAQFQSPNPNSLVVKGTLQVVQLIVADTPDIAEPALNCIAVLMRSMS